jgi:hypothetical protein
MVPFLPHLPLPSQLLNRVSVEDNQFFMRADDWSIVDPSARGRDSVRISSQSAYDDALFVLDLTHMPAGCATWPAFWTLSKAGPWPNGGEIDIIEGKFSTSHLSSLNHRCMYLSSRGQFEPDKPSNPTYYFWMHDAPRCPARAAKRVCVPLVYAVIGTMDSKNNNRTSVNTDCNTAVNFNAGCGVQFTGNPSSFGESFNQMNGGFYAMSKTQTSGIQVWFWPRSSSLVPPEIRHGAAKDVPIFPDWSWGPPSANFPMDSGYCDYAQHFNAHRMVFDLTLCVSAFSPSLLPRLVYC